MKRARKAATKRQAKPAAKAKPRKPSGLVTRRALAAAVGVHMQTVTKWEQEGMPIAKRGARGRPSYYREVDVRAWKQVRDEAAQQVGANAVQERARKEHFQAALAEQTLKIRSRDLLPREEVERKWAAEVAGVRTKLLSWTATLADQVYRVATLEGLPGVERVLQDRVRDVLRELADPLRPLPDSSSPSEAA